MWKPGRLLWVACPSSFQKAVAPSTRFASRSVTALKPIVIVLTLVGSPPDPATTDRRTAVSLGTPVIPTVLPWSACGDEMPGAAITADSGRWTIGRIPTMRGWVGLD